MASPIRDAERSGRWRLLVVRLGLAIALLSTTVAARASDAAAGLAGNSGLTGSWGGARAKLASRGVLFEGTLLADNSVAVSGGLRSGTALRTPVELRVSVDTGVLLGVAGGRAEAAFRRHAGRHATDALVGDGQGFDNLDAAAFSSLFVAWYEQSLLDSRLRVKVGKVDANTEFAYTEHGSAFLHSAAGYTPAIAGFPSYPAPAPSLNVAAEPAGWLHLAAGVYSHEAASGEGRAAFRIGEAGVRWRLLRRAGRLAAGGWTHGTSMPRAAGGGAAPRGAYAVLDHELWRTPDGRGLALFAQLGVSRGAGPAPIDQHVGLGVSWTGPLAGRSADVLGFLVSSARFRDRAAMAAARETALEALYAVRLAPWLGVTADLQCIDHPGGSARRALVASVRTELKL